MGPLIPVKTRVEGYISDSEQVFEGTMWWYIHDDERAVHKLLPKSYYIFNGKHRLLSPQHWAQVAQDNYPSLDGTCCYTYADRIILYWNQKKYSRTLPLYRSNGNTATLIANIGFHKYQAFGVEIGKAEHTQECILVYDTNVISNDEESDE